MEAKIFDNTDLWAVIEHDDVLSGYIGGAFACFKPSPKGVADGVWLTGGAQDDGNGALTLWVQDGSTWDHVVLCRQFNTPYDLPSTVDEPFDGVAYLVLWLREEAEACARGNYPELEELADLVEEALPDDYDGWEVSPCHDGRGGKWISVRRHGDDMGVYTIDDDPTDDACAARLWIISDMVDDPTGKLFNVNGGFDSAEDAAAFIAKKAVDNI